MAKSQDPFSSARINIDRAKQHIAEAAKFIREARPFRYIVETDVHRLERSIGVERDEAVIHHTSIICGDAIHRLRAALDHAYFAVVASHVPSARGKTGIQFPASKTAARLDEAVKNRMAHKVSPQFFAAVMALRPHGEPGGNELLYMIHELDIPDKHSSLIPTADYRVIRGYEIFRQVPDFPIPNMSLTVVEGRRDVVWPLNEMFFIFNDIPAVEIFSRGKFKKEIDIPVEITFKSGGHHYTRPLIPTLHQFVDVVDGVLDIFSEFV